MAGLASRILTRSVEQSSLWKGAGLTSTDPAFFDGSYVPALPTYRKRSTSLDSEESSGRDNGIKVP
jgi:hypothetical protein